MHIGFLTLLEPEGSFIFQFY